MSLFFFNFIRLLLYLFLHHQYFLLFTAAGAHGDDGWYL